VSVQAKARMLDPENSEESVLIDTFRSRVKGKAASSYTTTEPPGTAIDSLGDVRLSEFGNQDHFRVLLFRPEEITVLRLMQDMHLRMRALRKPDGSWACSWIVP
jgi:hypothetical protein